MTNKRRHKRVPLAASVTIKFNLEKDPEPMQAMAANISLSGIGLYSDKAIKEGTGLSIEITFVSAEGLMRIASIQGESVYSREIGGMFFTGIEFDEEINPIKQPFLYDHLQKILSWD